MDFAFTVRHRWISWTAVYKSERERERDSLHKFCDSRALTSTLSLDVQHPHEKVGSQKMPGIRLWFPHTCTHMCICTRTCAHAHVHAHIHYMHIRTKVFGYISHLADLT